MNVKEKSQSFNPETQPSITKEMVSQEFNRLFNQCLEKRNTKPDINDLWKQAKINLLQGYSDSQKIDVNVDSSNYLSKVKLETNANKVQKVDAQTFKEMQTELAIKIFTKSKGVGINDAYKLAFAELAQTYKKELPNIEKVELENQNSVENTEKIVPFGLAGIKSQVEILKKKSAEIGTNFIKMLTKSLVKSDLNSTSIAKINQSLYKIISSLESNNCPDLEIESDMNNLLDFIDNKFQNTGSNILETNTAKSVVAPDNFETLKKKLPLKLSLTLNNLQLLRPDLYNSKEIKLLARKTKFFLMGDFKLLEEIKNNIKDLDKIIKIEISNKFNQIVEINKVYPKYSEDVLNLGLKLDLLIEQPNFLVKQLIPEMEQLKLNLDHEKNIQIEYNNYIDQDY